MLVFQGGGFLGASEAGAYKRIYEFIKESEEKNQNNFYPIFDIIAESSTGAINAAILVGYVVEKGTYEGSAERLIDFWHFLSEQSAVEKFPFFTE